MELATEPPGMAMELAKDPPGMATELVKEPPGMATEPPGMTMVPSRMAMGRPGSEVWVLLAPQLGSQRI